MVDYYDEFTQLLMIIGIIIMIAIIIFYIVLLINDFIDNYYEYKGDVSATIVSVIVTDKYSEVTLNKFLFYTTPKTRYYIQVEYNGIFEVLETPSSCNVEIGDYIDVYLVVNEERSDRLVLNYVK